MLRSFVKHPLLKKALAAGEEQFGKALGQVLSGDRAGAALQTMLAAAGQARERLDRALRAALDAAQVPSTHDVDELKRRLSEMEALLDGLSARLAQAEQEGGDEGEGSGLDEGEATGEGQARAEGEAPEAGEPGAGAERPERHGSGPMGQHRDE